MTARSLVLLRHAKADTPRAATDEERPLSARGHADAQAAGAWLATRHVPELVYCSPAKRTRQTWLAVAANLPAGASPVVRYDRRLYLGGPGELVEMVREIEHPVTSVLVIGHNPSLSQLAFALDPTGRMDSDGLRTCGLSVHSVNRPWAECGPGAAQVTATHTARGD
jgi:phosphohistidine phosphatase